VEIKSASTSLSADVWVEIAQRPLAAFVVVVVAAVHDFFVFVPMIVRPLEAVVNKETVLICVADDDETNAETTMVSVVTVARKTPPRNVRSLLFRP